MRLTKSLSVAFICLMLSACVSSLLIGNQLQSKLMWSFLKPLVGFDPDEVNFFEAPIIKDRMTVLLGDKYEPTMKLLRTAQEIQQEGALFYVASRYAPPQAQAITDKAAMIWNADTNQMAVMLIKDGTPEIFSEQIEGAKQAITPVLPQELQRAYSKAQATKKALEEKQKALQDIQKTVENPLGTVTDEITEQVESTLDNTKNQAINKANASIDEATAPIVNQLTDEEREFDEALKKEKETLNKSP